MNSTDRLLCQIHESAETVRRREINDMMVVTVTYAAPRVLADVLRRLTPFEVALRINPVRAMSVLVDGEPVGIRPVAVDTLSSPEG